MNANQMEGAALARVMDPNVVGRLPLRRELNGAYRDIVQMIRDADTDICDDVQWIDLVEGENKYTITSDADSIRMVNRFDLSGQDLIADPIGVPIYQVPLQQMINAGRPAYAFGPDGFIIFPTPRVDRERGMRITFRPIAEELFDDVSTPRLPYQLHDGIVAKLVRRLGSLAGVQLTSGAADFIDQQEKYVMRFIKPTGAQNVTSFVRNKGLYTPRSKA